MRILFSTILMFLVVPILAQNTMSEKDKNEISLLLDKQVEAWNEGNLEKFMETYWKSDELSFVGSRGPTYGWEATLGNYKKGYPDKAKQLWQKATILDPNNTDCRFHLSALYLKNRKPLDALKLYEQITLIDPKNGVSYFFIGNISAQLNRFDDAEKAYKKVIEVAPKRSEGYHALARLYLQLNRNLPEAMKLAARAVELDPDNMQYRRTQQLIQERK